MRIGLRRIGVILGLSLLGWLAGAAVSSADEGRLLGQATGENAGGLSTDSLEGDPVEQPAARPIPLEVPLEVLLEEMPERLSVGEIPEEILRTEIITGARSPLTGEPLTAAEYAQLQAALDNPIEPNLVSNDLRYLVFLLQLRRAVRPILPFF